MLRDFYTKKERKKKGKKNSSGSRNVGQDRIAGEITILHHY